MVMAGNGYYPPEYGIEPGETCNREKCRGRMIVEMAPCPCDLYADCSCDTCGDENTSYVVVCGVCGSDPYDD